MQISGRTAFVTGANRGLGRHLAQQLRDRGANVYAAARTPESIDLDGVTPVALDLVDPESVSRAVAQTSDVSILINNAGSSMGASLLTGDWSAIRLEAETHYFGTLSLIRAFAPALARQDQSAILNILSVLSWLAFPGSGGYCAAKSAEWAMTNALRQELAQQGTRVIGLHVAYMDTGMTRNLDVPKADPADIATTALNGIEAESFEIIADDTSRMVQGGLAGGVAALYPDLRVAEATA